eukprot:11706692-Alexandrium_andersonii.AAC.1
MVPSGYCRGICPTAPLPMDRAKLEDVSSDRMTPATDVQKTAEHSVRVAIARNVHVGCWLPLTLLKAQCLNALP